MENSEVKTFLTLEAALRDTAEAAHGVAAVLENRNHTEEEFHEAIGKFTVKMLRLKKVTA